MQLVILTFSTLISRFHHSSSPQGHIPVRAGVDKTIQVQPHFSHFIQSPHESGIDNKHNQDMHSSTVHQYHQRSTKFHLSCVEHQNKSRSSSHSFLITTITTILVDRATAISAELYPNPVSHNTTKRSLLIEHSEHYIVRHTDIGIVLYP